MKLKERLGLMLFISILILAISPFSPGIVNAATVSDLSKEFICQCDCSMVVDPCDCETADQMRALIQQKIDEGQSPEQITAFFVGQYGEQVLASPAKRGLNLMAWIVPFAALAVGGGIVYLTLRKWVKRGKYSPAYASTKDNESEDKYRRQLEKELAEFDDRSFR
jgi:cytochrome c-type biogenesis protein CcmH